MKLLQITDTHMPAAGQRIYGVDARARLDACIDDINRHHADADLCILTGDLVNHGSTEEYANLKEALERLRVPFRVMVGNHDDRGQVLRFFPDTLRDADGHIQGVVDTPAGRLILLDTHDPGRSSGFLCERRLAWLSRRLAEDGGAPVFLFMHHPPLRVGIEYMDDIGLRNPDAFWACVGPHAGRIRLLVFGHLHRPISGTWKGIPFAACPSTVHQIALDLGPKPERKLLFNLEPPCYAIFQLAPEGVIAHQQRYTENWNTFERQGKAAS